MKEKKESENVKMKKILGVVVIAIVLMLLVIIIAISNKGTSKEENKKIVWNDLYGNQIRSEYDLCNFKNYSKYTYKTNGKNTLEILLPSKDDKDTVINDSLSYLNDGVEITVSKIDIIDKETEMEKIREIYENNYDMVHIKNTTYDDNIFAMISEIAKYNEDRTELPFSQETRIYVKGKNKNEYILVILNAQEKRIEEKDITKIINSIKVKGK